MFRIFGLGLFLLVLVIVTSLMADADEVEQMSMGVCRGGYDKSKESEYSEAKELLGYWDACIRYYDAWERLYEPLRAELTPALNHASEQLRRARQAYYGELQSDQPNRNRVKDLELTYERENEEYRVMNLDYTWLDHSLKQNALVRKRLEELIEAQKDSVNSR